LIKKVTLKNYRCFENSEIAFRGTSIIVGSNNAGKSTIIEALRIVAAISQKFKHTNYSPAPIDLELPASTKGLKVNIDHLKIDLRSVVHKYRESEGVFAEVSAYFDDSITIKLYLCSEFVFSTIEVNGKQIKSKSDALKAPDIHLYIMPQIGLIREDEQKLDPDRVKSHMSTRLSSRHFRNQLLIHKEHFEEFKDMAQSSWPGLRITDLSFDPDENKIELIVYDAEFAAEIGAMGSGLQMWLQMVWFISRCPSSCTIVLDEPDVYMHPDLQRKIFKIVQHKFKQTIVATHSVEIISSVQPHQIVTIDKATRKMKYADSFKAVQSVINNLGSEHNLSLIRLGSVKKCVFVEGKDIKTLSRFHEILYQSSTTSLDQLPTVSLGGWSRFDEALGAARLFYEETDGGIEVFCILDRDYHLQDEIDELYRKAAENHLNLYVWEKKEIENYIFTPRSVFKLTNLPEEKYDDFCAELFEELDKLKPQTLGGFLDQCDCRFRSQGHAQSTNLKIATDELEKRWSTLEKRLSVVNGKDLISLISIWVKERYKRGISRNKLLSTLTPQDIPKEMKIVIDNLIS
jgi:predicted ATPase